MKRRRTHVLLLMLLLACSSSLSQDPLSKGESNELRELIEQLGDEDFEKREAAQARLIEIGADALESLRAAAGSPDAEIAFRAQEAVRRLTSLSPEEQFELRSQGEEAFYAGDFETMSQAYKRLAQVANASIDDGRWLGHAYQLSSQWEKAASAYAAVIDRMDPLLDRAPGQDAATPHTWPSARERGLQERAALILLTARIQRHYLSDAVAAEKTLRRIYHYDDALSEPLEEIARKWEARLAESLALGRDAAQDGDDVRRSLALRFPLMALRELAEVQQLNGNHRDALETWKRIHWTTHQYVGFTESVDIAAIDRLLQELPEALKDAALEDAAPFVTLLAENRPSAEFDFSKASVFSRSYEFRQNHATFALAAAQGFEFATLEFTCDIEQFEPQYGGQFSCWALVRENAETPIQRKGIGDLHWPHDKNLGRDKLKATYAIEPGTTMVHFQAGSWKDKFKVHGVSVAATFRSPVSEKAASPLPGVSFHAEFLPPGGSIAVNGKPYASGSTTYGFQPGRFEVNYAHPERSATREFTLDLPAGARCSQFINLDSPFTGELTTLRGIDWSYGPGASIVKMADGRWLVAWCKTHGGLQFASSDDLRSWSKPTATSDQSLFNENTNCVAPSLFVDKEGTIWVAYFSNQLDIDQLHSGGYRLFLRSSKDGLEWSAPRTIRMSLGGWPPGNIHMLGGPDGKTWVLFRLQFAAVDRLEDFTEFKDLDLPATDVVRSHARNPHATFDAAGRLHLVWDHFAQSLCYARRDRDGRWSEPIEIVKPEKNAANSHPKLVLRGDRLALIHSSHQGAYLRRGELRDGAPRFGEPIKIAPHTAPLVGVAPLAYSKGSVELLTGSDTIWRQSATIDSLLGLLLDATHR